MKDVHGSHKYEDIVKMVYACFCLSHGNAAPERGFSDNKYVLENRDALAAETIVAIRMVKSAIRFYDGSINFPITSRLLALCKASRQKYQAYLDKQKLEKENMDKKKKNENDIAKQVQEKKKHNASQIQILDTSIGQEKKRMKLAENLVIQGNEALNKAVNSTGKLDRLEIVKAQSVLNAGVQQLTKTTMKIDDFFNKKNVLQKEK